MLHAENVVSISVFYYRLQKRQKTVFRNVSLSLSVSSLASILYVHFFCVIAIFGHVILVIVEVSFGSVLKLSCDG